jgi:2,3-bisphosphoglycerate-independent phosphoglycerate mutase
MPVPFITVDPLKKIERLSSGGKLCDIAPTILAQWGIRKPEEMTGKNLATS